MITFFRKNRRGIVGTFIVGMCVVLMLPFGIDYFGGGRSARGPLVKVGDKEISVLQYDRALEQYRGLLRRQLGENYEKFAAMINVKQKVLDELVDDAVLSEFIADSDLEVGVSHVEGYIRSLPIFSGDISRSKLLDFLRAQGISERQFQEDVKKAVLRSQLEDLFSLAGSLSSDELMRRYKLKSSEIVLSYAKVEDKGAQPEVKEQEIKDFYEENKNKFLSEKHYSLVSIKLPHEKFKAEVAVHDEDLQDAYRQYRGEFEIPAKAAYEELVISKKTPDFLNQEVSAPRNLDLVAKSAKEEISANPESFKEIAKSKGATYKIKEEANDISEELNEIKQSLSKMKEGEVSDVIETESAYYLLRLKTYQPASLKPFEEVREILEQRVREDLAPDMATYKAEELKSKLVGMTEEQLQNKIKPEIEKLGFVYESLSGTPSSMSVQEVLPLLSQSAQGDAFVVQGEGYVRTVYVRSIKPEQIRPLNEVSGDIKKFLTDKKKAEHHREYAKKIIAAARNAGQRVTYAGFKQLGDRFPLDYTDVKGTVGSITFPFLPQDETTGKIIAEVLSKGLVLAPVEGVDGSVYLIVLKERHDGSKEISQKERMDFLNEELRDASRRLEETFLNELKKNKEIEVNQEVFELFS